MFRAGQTVITHTYLLSAGKIAEKKKSRSNSDNLRTPGTVLIFKNPARVAR